MQQQHLASARNRRLAQQMENRPSVQAALNQKQVRPDRQASTRGGARAALSAAGGPSVTVCVHDPESEAAPGQGQHPGAAGPPRGAHDARRSRWRQRTAGDHPRGPARTSQRGSDEGGAVPARWVVCAPRLCSFAVVLNLLFSSASAARRTPVGGLVRGRGFAGRLAARRGARTRGVFPGRGAARGGLGLLRGWFTPPTLPPPVR